MAKAGRGDDQYMVRFPPGLRDRVKASAEANGRSMNSEILDRIERSFERYGSDQVSHLYILLDADGFPTSWDEVLTHLSKISAKGRFDPAVVQGYVFNGEVQRNEDREENWLELVNHYRSLKGLSPMDE